MMRTGLLLIALPALVSTGCMHNARINQQLMERELRLQEDCIYRLKWQLEDAQRELDAARAQLDTVRREADTLRDATDAAADLEVPSAIMGPSGRPAGEAPRLPPAPSLPSPAVEPGTEVPPGGTTSAPGASIDPPELRTPLAQASFVRGGNPLRADEAQLDEDATVEQIVINPKLTGGLNADGKPGDELLSVAIDQHDPAGHPVLAPGDVSIVVIDPAIPGKAARIARWDFEAEKLPDYVRQDAHGNALQFELPWPKQPEHRNLELHVRFTTYDGKRLQTSLPIEVQTAPRRARGGTDSSASLASHDEQVDDASAEPQSAPEENRSVYQQSNPAETTEEPAADDQPRQPPKWSPDR